MLIGSLYSDINKFHHIRHRYTSNATNSWTDGPLNKANLTAYNNDLTGLNVCWAGIDGTLTMRLWYASSNTTFEEYLYNNEERQWDWQKRWEGFSGTAGVGCVTDPDHPYVYAAFVNLQGSAEIYYRTRKDAHLAATGWEKCGKQNFSSLSRTDMFTNESLSGSSHPRRVPRIFHHVGREQDRRAKIRKRQLGYDSQHDLERQGHNSQSFGSVRSSR